MYTSNELLKLSRKIEKKYSNLTLENPYKTALFRSHVDAASNHLRVASELITCEVDEPQDDGTFMAKATVALMIIILFILIAFSLVG